MALLFEAGATAANGDYDRFGLVRNPEQDPDKSMPAWLPPLDGKAPALRNKKDDALIVLPHGMPGKLTAEQASRSVDALLRLNDDCVIASVVAICMWVAANGITIRYTDDGLPIRPPVRVHATDILKMQGTTPQVHGGYMVNQKQRAEVDLYTASSLYLKGMEEIWEWKGKRRVQRLVEVEGPLFAVEAERDLVTGKAIPYAYRVTPGSWIVHELKGWQQTALLFVDMLKFDATKPGSSRIALRLCLYLTRQWRIQSGENNIGQPFYVRTLLEGAHIPIPIPTHREQRRRLIVQFEDALDHMAGFYLDGNTKRAVDLERPKVIEAWQYDREYDTFDDWLGCRVQITPRAEIYQQYEKIPIAATKQIAAALAAGRRKRKQS